MAKFKFPWDDKGNFVEVEARTRDEAVEKVFGFCRSMAEAITADPVVIQIPPEADGSLVDYIHEVINRECAEDKEGGHGAGNEHPG